MARFLLVHLTTSLCAPFAVQALLPVAGIPLLEYSLEWLATQGVAEVLMFTVKHTREVKEYLLSSRWSSHLDTRPISSSGLGGEDGAQAHVSSPRLRLLSSTTAASAGDAIRAVDSMGALRSDGSFLLLESPVISCVGIRQALASHAARAQADSNTTLTALVQPRQLAGAAAPAAVVTAMAVDGLDGRLWGWKELPVCSVRSDEAWHKAVSKATVPKAARGRIQYKADLVPTGIYICTRSAAVHFSDNYDYRSISRDYVSNEVENVDMGWRFHVHVSEGARTVAPAEPAALLAVQSLVLGGAFGALSADGAWAAPLLAPVPAWNSRAPVDSLVSAHAHVDPSALHTIQRSFVAATASVSSGCTVTGSFLCERVQVEVGAVIIDSLVLPGAIVRSEAVLRGCIIGPDAVVSAGATVNPGVVLGKQVVVAPGHSVPSCARVTCVPYWDGFGDKPKRLSATNSASSDTNAVGQQGVGRLWPAAGELETLDADGDDDSSDEDKEEEEEGEGADMVRVTALLTQLRTAVAAYDAAARSARSSGASVPAARVQAVASAVDAAFASPVCAALLGGACGMGEVSRAAALSTLATTTESAATAEATGALDTAVVKAAGSTTVAAAAAAPAPVGAAAAASSSSKLNTGVYDILQGGRAKDQPPESSHVKALMVELTSIRLSTHSKGGDMLAALLPLVFDWLPRSEASSAGVLKHLKAWSSLLTPWAGTMGDNVEDQLKVVQAVEAYVTSAAEPGAPSRAPLRPLFGVILNVLYDMDVATDLGISEWAALAEQAVEDGSASKDTKELFEAKWTQLLMQRIDEEGADDEEEEEGEDEDEDD